MSSSYAHVYLTVCVVEDCAAHYILVVVGTVYSCGSIVAVHLVCVCVCVCACVRAHVHVRAHARVCACVRDVSFAPLLQHTG